MLKPNPTILPIAHLISESGEPQFLETHLFNVAEQASIFAEKFSCKEEGYLAGLIHDIGKYRDSFQKK